jgi:hypothetical protein
MTKKNKISVVIIDCGIDLTISDLADYVLRSTGFGINSEGYICETSEIKPTGKHGTCVSMIIRDLCRNTELISFNILNEKMATDSRIMIYAMNEAIKLEPDIIHMSIGTLKRKYLPYIKQIADMAIQKNITIVAACNNFGIRAYPACLTGVIGVKSLRWTNVKNKIIKRKNYFYAPSKIIDIFGQNELKSSQKMKGTSIAAAYVTGYIAQRRFENDTY